MKDKNFYKEIDKEKKKRGCFIFSNCCLTVFILFVLLVFFATGAIAATGLVEIPFFTSIFYKEPSPSQVVTPTQIDENVVIEKLSSISVDDQNKITLDLTSEEVTGLIYNFIKENNTFDKSQILFVESSAEIFSQIKNPLKFYLNLDVGPTIIQDGKLVLRANKAKLGNLRLPVFIINPLVKLYLSGQNLKMQLSPELEIIDLEVVGNKIKITFLFTGQNLDQIKGGGLFSGNSLNSGSNLPFKSEDVEKFKSMFGDKIPTQEELEKFFGGDLPSEEELEKFKKEVKSTLK